MTHHRQIDGPRAPPRTPLAASRVGMALTRPVAAPAITEPVSSARLLEVHPSAAGSRRSQPPLATEGVQRYVWESKFGANLIEVVGEEVFVNGELVELVARCASSRPALARCTSINETTR